MSQADYHAETETVSTSQFKVFCKSPAEYHATFVAKTLEPKATSRQMNAGTVVHAILLERKSIDDIVRKYPHRCRNINGGLIGKVAKDFEEEIKPAIAVKDDEYERIVRMCEMALMSPLGEVLRSNAKFEHRLDAEIEGVACRCKPDIHEVIEGRPVIWDLKTTERIAPDDWWRTAKQMGYGIQDAMYSLIAEKHYGSESSTFRFWAVETVKCHRIQPYWHDDRSREIAKDYVKTKLADFARRKETNNWSDNWDNQGTIGPWDLGQSSDNELEAWEE